MRTDLQRFVLKGLLLVALLYLPLFLLGQLDYFAPNKDPRRFLFTQDDFSAYHYAIIGDSVFCSYYVDRPQQTMWSRFEAISGKKCFPGALNGATIADMVSAAEYLGEVLPEGSTVFVGLIPTRFVGKGIVRHQNYFSEFYRLQRDSNELWIKRLATRVGDLLLDPITFYRNPEAFEKALRRKRRIVYDQGNYSWRDKMAEAERKYRKFVQVSNSLDTYIDEVALSQIRSGLTSHNIQPVFVLSPINMGLIEQFSDPDEARHIKSKLNDAHKMLENYLKSIDVKYVDLYDKVGTECFIDMVHINACGDAIVGQALADFVSK